MTQMIYKRGGETKVWGIMATVMVIDADQVDDHVKDGWLTDPNMLLIPKEPEATVKTRKTKAATDEHHD